MAKEELWLADGGKAFESDPVFAFYDWNKLLMKFGTETEKKFVIGALFVLLLKRPS